MSQFEQVHLDAWSHTFSKWYLSGQALELDLNFRQRCNDVKWCCERWIDIKCYQMESKPPNNEWIEIPNSETKTTKNINICRQRRKWNNLLQNVMRNALNHKMRTKSNYLSQSWPLIEWSEWMVFPIFGALS